MHFKGMEKVADLIIVNLLFLAFSLPVFTIGASTTAMHYCLRRWREGDEQLTKAFMKSFRLNFRQATVLWCVFLLLAAAVGGNLLLVRNWTGYPGQSVTALLMIVGAALLGWVSVVFPFLARFDNTTGNIARNALLIALVSPGRAAVAAVMNAFPLVLAAVLPGVFLISSVMWLLLLCSASALGVQLLFAPVFDRIGK